MNNIIVVFEEYEDNGINLVGYEHITGHFVFDMKLGNRVFRKERYCSNGHKDRPKYVFTYSTIVAQDYVSIMKFPAAFIDI